MQNLAPGKVLPQALVQTLRGTQLGSSRKGPEGVTVDSPSWAYASNVLFWQGRPAKSWILGYIRPCIVSRSKEVILPLSFCTELLHQFWAPHYERGMDILKSIQQRWGDWSMSQTRKRLGRQGLFRQALHLLVHISWAYLIGAWVNSLRNLSGLICWVHYFMLYDSSMPLSSSGNLQNQLYFKRA